MKYFKYTTKEQIKPNLKPGDYEMLSSMVGGVYTPETIRHMINGRRTMKDVVLKKVNKLIETRENLIK